MSSSLPTLPPVAWTVVSLGLLILTQRWFQRQLQILLAETTHDPKVMLIVYALIFVPGAAVHEISHWLAAWCLRVRTISFSLVPKRGEGGNLRLGYVETVRTDPIRAAIIGVAPLLTGVVLLVLLTLNQLALEPVIAAAGRHDLAGVVRTLSSLPQVPDVGLWMYLVIAISNTMLPSAADRSAWLPAALIVLALGLMIAWSGLELRDNGWLATQLRAILPRLTAVFVLTALLNLVLAPILWALGRLAAGARRVIPG